MHTPATCPSEIGRKHPHRHSTIGHAYTSTIPWIMDCQFCSCSSRNACKSALVRPSDPVRRATRNNRDGPRTEGEGLRWCVGLPIEGQDSLLTRTGAKKSAMRKKRMMLQLRVICGMSTCSRSLAGGQACAERGLVVGQEEENGKTLLRVSSRQTPRNAASAIVPACLMLPAWSAALARSFDVPRT